MSAKKSSSNQGRMQEGGVVDRLPLQQAMELGLLDSGRRSWDWLNREIEGLGEEMVVMKPPQGVGMALFRARILTSGRRLLRGKGWRLRTKREGGKMKVWREEIQP